MSIDKILLATDFSPEADVATRQALDVARHTGASVTMMNAVPMLEEEYTPLLGPTERAKELIAARVADHRASLEALRERFSGQGVQLSHVVADGYADDAIASVALETNADLVVLGTHGRTGWKRLTLGSIAERVVRIAATDVLVARRRPHTAGGFMRILVPTDFSPTAEQALQRAIELVHEAGTIELYHLWEVPVVAEGDWGLVAGTGYDVQAVRDNIAESVAARGNDLVAAYRDAWPQLWFDSARAPAAEGIRARLDAGDYDLVCLGSHGRRGVRRWLLGSVAEATVRHAPCSVLVARGKTEA